MSDEQISGLKFRSLGIVVTSKVLGESTIVVDPIEDFILDSGEIKPDGKKTKSTLPTAAGIPKKTSIESGSAITAKWFPFGSSNRATPPDVCANETVMLWQFADAAEYYWTPCMFEPSLRRLERVRYMYSNLPSGQTPFDEDSSYWFEVSTVDQRLRLHTSDNNGEAAAYDFELNTKEGTFSLKDNLGNDLLLSSPEGTLDATVTEAVRIKTKDYSVECDSYTVKTKSMSLSSETPADVQCDMNMTGQMKLKGDLDVDGNVDSTGTITDAGGNTNHHSH